MPCAGQHRRINYNNSSQSGEWVRWNSGRTTQLVLKSDHNDHQGSAVPRKNWSTPRCSSQVAVGYVGKPPHVSTSYKKKPVDVFSWPFSGRGVQVGVGQEVLLKWKLHASAKNNTAHTKCESKSALRLLLSGGSWRGEAKRAVMKFREGEKWVKITPIFAIRFSRLLRFH